MSICSCNYLNGKVSLHMMQAKERGIVVFCGTFGEREREIGPFIAAFTSFESFTFVWKVYVLDIYPLYLSPAFKWQVHFHSFDVCLPASCLRSYMCFCLKCQAQKGKKKPLCMSLICVPFPIPNCGKSITDSMQSQGILNISGNVETLP